MDLVVLGYIGSIVGYTDFGCLLGVLYVIFFGCLELWGGIA